jgi:carbonic anhydrase
MDARIEPLGVLGLDVGDAHVIRNAGGIVTDDVRRSLETSRQLGTEAVVVMGHRDCGLGPGEEERVRQAMAELAGVGEVTGYVFDPDTGALDQVSG